MSTKPEETKQGVIALAFANAVVRGDYKLAHGMLSASLQAAISPKRLAEDFDGMIAYAESPPENKPSVEVMEAHDEWATKEDGDIGWAYVAMSNDYYSEAVSVVAAREQGRSIIREIGWGRP